MSHVTLPDWDAIDIHKFADEEAYLETCLKPAPLNQTQRAETVKYAHAWVETARQRSTHGGRPKGLMESFLEEFGLSNAEGLALMCLAEALLRVPDAETRDELIAEKIRSGDWNAHMGQSESWLVNASTWGLLMTGRIIGPSESTRRSGPTHFIQNLVRESGEPVIRAAVMQAMRLMGEQFVLGRTIDAAIKRGRTYIRASKAAHMSFDMLGEGARTFADARRYYAAYENAIDAIAQSTKPSIAPEEKSGISVKLTALHPRYDAVHEHQIMDELYPSLLALAEKAAHAHINLCLDAEEADRLGLQLKLISRLMCEPSLAGWQGLGLAVQAYQKRAHSVITHLADFAAKTERRLMIRLVKGAYWDSEIKHAQEMGHPNFPVFTTKAGTDLHYLKCARAMLMASPVIYPQFATHNAHTVAAVRVIAQEIGVSDFEYQRLHGMGDALFDAAGLSERVRIYAPVGAHKDLLPYLVRRLLENGANTSFVNSFLNADVPIRDVVSDPISALEIGPRRHPRIPTPPRLYGAQRINSKGLDLTQAKDRDCLKQAQEAVQARLPLTISASALPQTPTYAHAPFDPDINISIPYEASLADINQALDKAQAYAPQWDALGGAARQIHLLAMADTLEAHMPELIALMALEAGKTWADGIAEVREAVDFCRYYGAQAQREFETPIRLPGPAGETNHLSLHGRGVFACISPWNFPLAIFTGQIAAALAAGNTVVAKPSEQTPAIAARAVALFHAAGLPTDALTLLPGRGESVGAALCKDPRISGVCFTGGTDTARLINRALAKRPGPIMPLIAETGGLNAMFVDTTALREQVIDDIITSAFGSAGQRCSALRLVFLPHATADHIIEGLIGAMDALHVGDPRRAETDIGPVIDAAALENLQTYIDGLGEKGEVLHRIETPQSGYFFSPTLIALRSLDDIHHEVFGPVLHILRYDPDDITHVGNALKSKGYGLTLGVHSRLESFIDTVKQACPVGNCYVNRSMIGAVVGVQPFGGEGLSGTGPKAGGPHYLHRFATERVVSVDITAQGGDPELLNL